MSEHLPDGGPDPERQDETGVAEVDEVIRSVRDLDQRPVEEHVGVFESAHERLRRALDTS